MSLVLACLLTLVAIPAHSQAGATLRGVVRDDSRTVLPGAELLLSPLNRSILADARGEFQFDNIAPGSYLLLARAVGYEPARIALRLEGNARTLNVTLRKRTQTLDSILVTEARRGLYGVVGDSALRPVVGARVTVHGAWQASSSDSTGRFAFPDLHPGTYGVAVEHPGQTTRNKVVTVPERGSTEIVIRLVPLVPGQPRIPGASTAMSDLGRRMGWATRETILGSEELRRFPGRRLCDVPRMWRMFRDRSLIVIENGTRVLRHMSLCDLKADELEMVEWGTDCDDLTGGVGMLLGSRCDGAPEAWSSRRGAYGTWVMVWTRS